MSVSPRNPVGTGGAAVPVSAASAIPVSAAGGRLLIMGNSSAAATDTGNPVKIGGVGKTTNPTAVTDAQRVDAIFDKVGRQIVVPYHSRELISYTYTAITSVVATTIIVASAGGSVFQDLAYLSVANLSATAGTVTIRDDQGGTIDMVLSIPANQTIIFQPHVLMPQASAGVPWTAACSGASQDFRILAGVVRNV